MLIVFAAVLSARAGSEERGGRVSVGGVSSVVISAHLFHRFS
jgi:hypothetical protein